MADSNFKGRPIITPLQRRDKSKKSPPQQLITTTTQHPINLPTKEKYSDRFQASERFQGLQ